MVICVTLSDSVLDVLFLYPSLGESLVQYSLASVVFPAIENGSLVFIMHISYQMVIFTVKNEIPSSRKGDYIVCEVNELFLTRESS